MNKTLRQLRNPMLPPGFTIEQHTDWSIVLIGDLCDYLVEPLHSVAEALDAATRINVSWDNDLRSGNDNYYPDDVFTKPSYHDHEVTYYCPRGCQVFHTQEIAPECGSCGATMETCDVNYGDVHQAIEDEGIARAERELEWNLLICGTYWPPLADVDRLEGMIRGVS